MATNSKTRTKMSNTDRLWMLASAAYQEAVERGETFDGLVREAKADAEALERALLAPKNGQQPLVAGEHDEVAGAGSGAA
jgi:hypothetical protein